MERLPMLYNYPIQAGCKSWQHQACNYSCMFSELFSKWLISRNEPCKRSEWLLLKFSTACSKQWPCWFGACELPTNCWALSPRNQRSPSCKMLRSLVPLDLHGNQVQAALSHIGPQKKLARVPETDTCKQEIQSRKLNSGFCWIQLKRRSAGCTGECKMAQEGQEGKTRKEYVAIPLKRSHSCSQEQIHANELAGGSPCPLSRGPYCRWATEGHQLLQPGHLLGSSVAYCIQILSCYCDSKRGTRTEASLCSLPSPALKHSTWFSLKHISLKQSST